MGIMKTNRGLSSKSQDLMTMLAHRRDSFEAVLENDQWGNVKYEGITTESEKVCGRAVNGVNGQGHYPAQSCPTYMNTPRTAWPCNPYNFPDIAQILEADPTPDYESDIPIDLPLWGYFSKAMDQTVLDVQDAIKAGECSSPSWAKEEKLFRVDKQRKLDNTASISTAQNELGSDEIKWAQPTEQKSGLELDGAGLTSHPDEDQAQPAGEDFGLWLDGAGATPDNITWAQSNEEQVTPDTTASETTSQDGDSSVSWAFSHLAKDAEFSFTLAQNPESYEEIPTWSDSMYHSCVFPYPSKAEPAAEKKPASSNSWDDFTFGKRKSSALDMFAAEEVVVDEAAGRTRSLARRPSPLSEQINLEEWKLSHILNDKGLRPRSGSDLASRFRPRTKSVWDDQNRRWNVVPRSPSPPAQRPTAWQKVPASSYVYRVAGLRFPKVFADQVELSEDRKDIIRNGRQAAREAEEAEKQRVKDEQRRISWEKAEEKRKKELLEWEMKVLDGYLWSLRYLFREEGDEQAEEEEEDAWGWGGRSDGKVCDEEWGDDWTGWGREEEETEEELEKSGWGNLKLEEFEDDSWKNLPVFVREDEEESQGECGGAPDGPAALLQMDGASEKAEEEGETDPWVTDSRGPDKFEEPSGDFFDWGDSTPNEESAGGKEKGKKRSHLFTWFSNDFMRNAIREKVKEAENKGVRVMDTLACGKRKRADA